MNRQAKFIALVEAAAKDAGLDLINDTDWANTGTLRVQRPGDFNDCFRLRYDFQTDYQTLRLFAAGSGREGTYLPRDLDAAYKVVRDSIARLVPKPQSNVVAWARKHINDNAAEWETGGGCRAIGIRTDDSGHWLITVADDSDVPTSLEVPVCVGRYDDSGEHWICFTCPDMAAAARLIESCSACSF